MSARVSSRLLLVHLLLVELELLTLKNVSVSTARLSRTGGNASQKTTAVELIGKLLFENSILLVSGKLSLHMARSLGGSAGLVGLFLLLRVEFNIVFAEIPSSEGVGINQNDGVLDKSLGTHKLVIGGVINNIENLGLPGDSLGTPGVVANIKSQSSELVVTPLARTGLTRFGWSLVLAG
jgi:hypothetical protein